MDRLKRFLRPTRACSQTPTQDSSPARSSTATEHPQGLDVIIEGSDPIIDIVAIHGLNGHRDKTWTAKNGVHWLRDLLPDDIPRARILCWGYDAKTHSASGTSTLYLYNHALDLVSGLSRKRKLTNSSQRPIIFIAHSLGGIILKSALIHSDAARHDTREHRSIKLSTHGIIFMGTPHRGGNGVQLGRILTNVASLFMEADDRILKNLGKDSEWLQQQLGQYSLISGDFVTKFAYEEYPTPIALGKSILVVPRDSAVVTGQAGAESIVIHANHKNMVKFDSNLDTGYITISEHLTLMLDGAEENIRSRWQAELRANDARENRTNFSLSFSLSEVTEVNHFVAREEELAQMHKILTASPDRHTVVIHGLGGMGKTQLAIEFMKRHRDHCSAIIWMNATNEVTLRQSFAKAADRILQQHPSVPYVEHAVSSHDVNDAVRAVKRWLNEPNNQHWLIVYDNYDNPHFGGKAEPDNTTANVNNERARRRSSWHEDTFVSTPFDIRPFIPEAYHGAIIITTRSSIVAIGKTIRLSKLKYIEESLRILESTSNRERLIEDPAAIELARRLDGLPLALSSAGAFLDQTQVPLTFEDYLKLYNESWLRLQRASPRLLAYEDRAMYSTWNVSYDHVEKKNESASMLLKLWAYFSHDDLWHELLHAGARLTPPWLQALADKLAFVDAMRMLCDHGLVEVKPASTSDMAGSRGYNVHGCVHDWMINVLHDKTNREMAQLAMACVAWHLPDPKTHENWQLPKRVFQHVDRCLELITQGMEVPDSDRWVYRSFAYYYAIESRFSEAEVLCERYMQVCKRILGPHHTDTLYAFNNIGTVYCRQGRFNEAEAMFERALSGHEKTARPDDVLKLKIIANLGPLYQAQGRVADSEAIHERALQGYEKIYGPEHIETLLAICRIGLFYYKGGRLNEAEAMYNRAFQEFERTWEPMVLKTYVPALECFHALGLTYEKQGRQEQASQCYSRAIEGVRIVYGDDDKWTRKLSRCQERIRI